MLDLSRNLVRATAPLISWMMGGAPEAQNEGGDPAGDRLNDGPLFHYECAAGWSIILVASVMFLVPIAIAQNATEWGPLQLVANALIGGMFYATAAGVLFAVRGGVVSHWPSVSQAGLWRLTCRPNVTEGIALIFISALFLIP